MSYLTRNGISSQGQMSNPVLAVCPAVMLGVFPLPNAFQLHRASLGNGPPTGDRAHSNM